VKRIVAVACLARAGLAVADDAPRWTTYAALRNDAFTDLTPPLDDRGFTHDNVFSLLRADGDLALGGRAIHRWLTSNTDRRRWDQVDLVALIEWRPALTICGLRVDTQGRLGPTLGGNFGGRYLQNGWHTASGTGPTLDQGLANDYPGDRRLGMVTGLRARGRFGDDRTHGFAVLDGQLGLGGGVSSIETALGGSASTRHFGIDLELAITRYRVSDELLALPGGYGAGWQIEWRAGFHVAWSRFRLSYQYRMNEGGSGEPIGVIAFESKR
jgi:hypothetical protein